MTRRVCVDARMIHASGIGTYLRGLLEGVKAQPEPSFDLTLLGKCEELPKGPWNTRPLSSPIYSLREQWAVPKAYKASAGDLLHAPHYNLPIALAAETVVTVHDLIHLKFPEYLSNPLARFYARFFFHQIIPRAKAILAVSEWSKKDLTELTGVDASRIHVVYPAISTQFRPHSSQEQAQLRQQLALPERYFLYVGNLKETKNVPALVRSFSRLRERRAECPDLVLVGRNFIPGFEATIKGTTGVQWRGEVQADKLPALYALAQAFVFPSLYEGFGLPPLEAMASGVPVICSNRSSLPEVTGKASLLVDPNDEIALSSAMERVLDDQPTRQKLIQEGLEHARTFTKERFAQGVLKVYALCLNA